jgi:hypothetical protein
MQVFNSEFVQAVRNHLNGMTVKYVTREELCKALGVSVEYSGAISIMFETGLFPEFETIRSRGIRRRELKAAA